MSTVVQFLTGTYEKTLMTCSQNEDLLGIMNLQCEGETQEITGHGGGEKQTNTFKEGGSDGREGHGEEGWLPKPTSGTAQQQHTREPEE